MTLLSSFKAARYRGIDGLSLPRLTPANLVTGVNGIGKTALIEAMWLFMGRYNQTLLWNRHVHRFDRPVLDPVERLSGDVLELHGIENGSSRRLKHVFEKVADTAHIPTPEDATDRKFSQLPVTGRIATCLDGEPVEGNPVGGIQTPWGMVTLQNPVPPKPRPSCVIEGMGLQLEISSEHLQRYSDIVREGRKEELTNAINLMLPKVKGLEMLADNAGGSYLSAMITDGRQLPLHDLGGGVVRLSRLLLNFFASRNGILLSDEIENGIHHAVLREIWIRARHWIHEWNVQLVATTHSAECIEAAMTAYEDAPEELSIHKLFLNEETGRVQAATFSGESLQGARDLDLEVR